jgi:hypothetical protein
MHLHTLTHLHALTRTHIYTRGLHAVAVDLTADAVLMPWCVCAYLGVLNKKKMKNILKLRVYKHTAHLPSLHTEIMAHSTEVQRTIQALQARVSMLKVNRLNANLGTVRVDDRHYTVLGSGDDGDVILAENTEEKPEKYVLKVYKRTIMKNDAHPDIAADDQEDMDKIVADQALREFTALKLMRGHPNVSRLISTEVDTCHLHMEDNDFPGSILIRMEYIPNAITLADIEEDPHSIDMATLGIVRTMRGSGISYHIDFRVRVKLIGYLFGQCFSVTDELRRHGIHHRDCDACNIVISFPSLRLVLLDFARADIPGMKKIEEVMQERSSFKIKWIKNKRYRNLNIYDDSDRDTIFSHLKMVVRKSCMKGFFKNYTNEKKAIEIMIDAMKKNPEQYDIFEPPVRPLRQFQEVWEIYTDKRGLQIPTLDDPVNNELLLQLLEAEDSSEDKGDDKAEHEAKVEAKVEAEDSSEDDDSDDDEEDIDPPDKLSPPRKIAKS